MKKSFVLFLTVLSAVGLLRAQHSVVSDNMSVDFGVRIGSGALLPSGHGREVDYKAGLTWGLDGEFSYFVNSAFGFTTGIGITFLNSAMGIDTINSNYLGQLTYNRGSGSPTSYSQARCVGRTQKVKETYKSTFFEVPLLLAVRTGNFIFHGGVKLAIPTTGQATFEKGNTDIDLVEVVNLGIKLNPPISLTEGAPTNNSEGEYTIYGDDHHARPLYVMGVLEAGYRVPVFMGGYFGFGAYFEYSFNHDSFNNVAGSELVSINGSNVQSYNGFMNSDIIEHCWYYKVGFRFQLGFGVRHHTLGGRGSHSPKVAKSKNLPRIL